MNPLESEQPDTWEAIEEALSDLSSRAVDLQTRIAALAGIPDELAESEIEPETLQRAFASIVNAEMECDEARMSLKKYVSTLQVASGSI